MKKIFLLLLISLNTLTVSAQKPEWFSNLQKLQKFPSTEKEVEGLFSSPKITYSTPSEKIISNETKGVRLVKYELPEGSLDVLYSSGKCTEKNQEGYNLEDGVIIYYYFELKNLVPVSMLKVNLKKLILTRPDDTKHMFYKDSKKGVTYTVLGGKLQYLKFSAPLVDSMRCENKTNS